MSNIEELNNTPTVTLIDTNVDNLMARAVQSYENEYKKQTGEDLTLMPADKNRILLQTAVYLVMMNLIASDTMYKQGTLKDATGDSLDAVGATRGSVKRPEPQYAIVTEKYIFDGALSEQRTIPKGNRVSVGEVYFETTEETIVSIGTSEVTLTLKCTESGIIGNGYLPGTITTHTDSLAWVKSVTNIETSQGGTDPDDDDYTRKIYNTPEGYSVAGPTTAYITKSKEFSDSIQDVCVITPDDSIDIEYTYNNGTNNVTETKSVDIAAGTIDISSGNVSSYVVDLSGVEIDLNFTTAVKSMKLKFTRGGIVEIYPLLTGSQIPNSAFLSELKESLSSDTERPLTDKVETKAPSEKTYSINFEYYIDKVDSSTVESIKSNVNSAVINYQSWQKNKLGKDINPDELIKLVKEAGAKRLVLTSPVYNNLEPFEVAKCTSVSVTYKGLE